MDLEELLAELEEESQINEAEDQEEKYVGDDEKYEFEKGKEAGEEEEFDLEDMSEEDLKALIEDVIEDMVKAGEIEAGENFEAEDDMEMNLDMETDAEEEETIDEMYGGNEGDIPSAKRGKIKKDTAEEEGIADYEKSKKKMKVS